jgi:hypothetical protein
MQNDVKVIELIRFEDNVKVLTKFEIKGKTNEKENSRININSSM